MQWDVYDAWGWNAGNTRTAHYFLPEYLKRFITL